MRPALGIGFGLLMIAIGGLGVVMLPGAIADTTGYAVAHRCAFEGASGCWFEVPAAVVETHIDYHSRGSSDWVATIQDRFGQHSMMVWHRAAFNELGPGTPVTVRYWDGRPVLLELRDGSTLPSDSGPGSNVLFAVLATVIGLPFGIFYVYAAMRVGRSGSWWTAPGRTVYDEMLVGAFAHLPGHTWMAMTFALSVVAFVAWRLLGIEVWPAVAIGAAVMAGLVLAGHLRHLAYRSSAGGSTIRQTPDGGEEMTWPR